MFLLFGRCRWKVSPDQPEVQGNKMDSAEQAEAPATKLVVRKESMDKYAEFKKQSINQPGSEVFADQSVPLHQKNLDPISVHLEEKIVLFVKNELRKIQKVLAEVGPGCLTSQNETDEGGNSKNLFLNMTLNSLRAMKEEALADNLQQKTHCTNSREEIKSKLKKRFC